MAGDAAETPVVPFKNEIHPVSEFSSSRRQLNYDANLEGQTSPDKSSKEFLLSVATRLASQRLSNPDSTVWAVLTAISIAARKRSQGINMLLNSQEHFIGRLVEDARFRIDSTAVSGRHCRIFRKHVEQDDDDSRHVVFLKDTSTNGTYLNWKKLSKSSPEAPLSHGDIISFANFPHHEMAYTFVYREVSQVIPSMEKSPLKRKAENIVHDNKRMKGIGIGAPDGPLSLDDFRSLQRSNNELRKQLENQISEIAALKTDNRVTIERHEKEISEAKDFSEKLFSNKIKELEVSLDSKEKELSENRRISVEQKQAIQDLNERIAISNQSHAEANEIIKSQKVSLTELELQLKEQREQHEKERQKACAELRAALERVQSEAREEAEKLSNASHQRQKELQEEIAKLQEREKKWSEQVESLRPKLEDVRKKLVDSENKVRLLEAQISEEQTASSSERKKVEKLHLKTKSLEVKLENEKAAREEAWAKVSSLELEINSAMQDLEHEKRGLKGARERIMLRETQLRAFYSTTEEISLLFAKQQEQLKSMQKTLEDEEKYGISIENSDQCGNRTREEECSCGDPNSKRGFGSDINGFDPTPVGTDQVFDTEPDGEPHLDNTMQLDDEGCVPESEALAGDRVVEDSESIRTCDLLASEVAGSWAGSTPPSHDGDCELKRSSNGGLQSCLVVAESQTTSSSRAVYRRREMVAPPYGGGGENDGSNSDTLGCSDAESQPIRVVSISDSETEDDDVRQMQEQKDEDDDDTTEDENTGQV